MKKTLDKSKFILTFLDISIKVWFLIKQIAGLQGAGFYGKLIPMFLVFSPCTTTSSNSALTKFHQFLCGTISIEGSA